MAVWEPEGEHWIRWARTPGFDSYWYFRDAVFDPLEDYARAFESAGLRIDRIREPRPAQHPDRYDWCLDVPLFLALRVSKH